jgi:hypothetical protein
VISDVCMAEQLKIIGRNVLVAGSQEHCYTQVLSS